MTGLSPTAILQFLNTGGVLGLAVLGLFLFVTGRLRPGSDIDRVQTALDDMRKDRDDWKAIATRGTDQMSSLVQVAQIFREIQGAGGDKRGN